ncbi:MAG: hypothetical protein ACOC20_06040, partial [Oceanicaulis sp.]
TLFCEISAKYGKNIDEFLETLLLQAEILELHADPEGPADGVVVEAMLNQQRGIEATLLVKEGVLKVGDIIVSGQTYGRIRSMLDNLGRPIEKATPSFPARIYGLTGEPPEAGEPFLALEDEREARQIAEKRANRRRQAGLNGPGTQREHLESQRLFHKRISGLDARNKTRKHAREQNRKSCSRHLIQNGVSHARLRRRHHLRGRHHRLHLRRAVCQRRLRRIGPRGYHGGLANRAWPRGAAGEA